ncbi:MAG: response regulator [Pirellulaceae bacterium]
MTKLTILVADDSSTVRTMVKRILEGAGHTVVTAVDGAEAVTQIREHSPDLAVLDVVMPGVDGYAVCEQLKQMGTPWSELPIVFLTCVKSRALELLGQEYGAYLNKPVQAEPLLSAIENHFSRSA